MWVNIAVITLAEFVEMFVQRGRRVGEFNRGDISVAGPNVNALRDTLQRWLRRPFHPHMKVVITRRNIAEFCLECPIGSGIKRRGE